MSIKIDWFSVCTSTSDLWSFPDGVSAHSTVSPVRSRHVWVGARVRSFPYWEKFLSSGHVNRFIDSQSWRLPTKLHTSHEHPRAHISWSMSIYSVSVELLHNIKFPFSRKERSECRNRRAIYLNFYCLLHEPTPTTNIFLRNVCMWPSPPNYGFRWREILMNDSDLVGIRSARKFMIAYEIFMSVKIQS